MTFQSIIDALNNHADAVRALAEAMKASEVPGPAPAPQIPEEPVAISSPAVEADAPEMAVQPTKSEVNDALAQLAASDRGREAAVAVLTSFGVKKISELDKSQYQKFIEACQ